jgi:hypothetical protein
MGRTITSERLRLNPWVSAGARLTGGAGKGGGTSAVGPMGQRGGGGGRGAGGGGGGGGGGGPPAPPRERGGASRYIVDQWLRLHGPRKMLSSYPDHPMKTGRLGSAR